MNMDVDTTRIRALRDQLVELSPRSVPPRDPAPRALSGSPEEDAVVARFLPFGELILLVARVDGSIGEREEKAVLGAFVALTGGRVPRATIERVKMVAEERLRFVSPLDRLERVCVEIALSREDAELAFVLASAVALADDTVEPSESELLLLVAECLGISRRRADELVQSARSRRA